MKLTRKSLKQVLSVVVATVGLTLLAVPAGVSQAAVFPSGPQSSPFEARIVQGPDAGAVLAGTLSLQLVGHTHLRGSLVVGPVAHDTTPAQGTLAHDAAPQQSLTTETLVPVTGEVYPASHRVWLSFNLGNGRTLQTLLTSGTPIGGSHALSAQLGVHTVGPQRGDSAALFYIHIHIQGDGWSIDIYIGKI